MKITKKQLKRIINEYHPRPDDDYDPLNPDEFGRESPEDDMDYDRGLEAGCYGWPRDTSFGPAYDDGYDQGVIDAEDPDSECNREHAEEFGPRREGKIKITKRQLRRVIKEEKKRLLTEAAVPKEELEAAVLQIFYADGAVGVTDVYDRLRMDGYTDEDISAAIDSGGGAPWME
jgi:hypothetical protein